VCADDVTAVANDDFDLPVIIHIPGCQAVAVFKVQVESKGIHALDWFDKISLVGGVIRPDDFLRPITINITVRQTIVFGKIHIFHDIQEGFVFPVVLADGVAKTGESACHRVGIVLHGILTIARAAAHVGILALVALVEMGVNAVQDCLVQFPGGVADDPAQHQVGCSIAIASMGIGVVAVLHIIIGTTVRAFPVKFIGTGLITRDDLGFSNQQDITAILVFKVRVHAVCPFLIILQEGIENILVQAGVPVSQDTLFQHCQPRHVAHQLVDVVNVVELRQPGGSRNDQVIGGTECPGNRFGDLGGTRIPNHGAGIADTFRSGVALTIQVKDLGLGHAQLVFRHGHIREEDGNNIVVEFHGFTRIQGIGLVQCNGGNALFALQTAAGSQAPLPKHRIEECQVDRLEALEILLDLGNLNRSGGIFIVFHGQPHPEITLPGVMGDGSAENNIRLPCHNVEVGIVRLGAAVCGIDNRLKVVVPQRLAA